MLKASRVFFAIGILLALFACVSVYLSLSSGDKMMERASAYALSDAMKARVDKAKAQIADIQANLPLHIAELAAGVAAGVLGLIGAGVRRRGPVFFTLEALCLICIAALFASKTWLTGAVYLVAFVLGFIKIMQLTKGGAVIPEE